MPYIKHKTFRLLKVNAVVGQCFSVSSRVFSTYKIHSHIYKIHIL
jgi:hypothetical protein